MLACALIVFSRAGGGLDRAALHAGSGGSLADCDITNTTGPDRRALQTVMPGPLVLPCLHPVCAAAGAAVAAPLLLRRRVAAGAGIRVDHTPRAKVACPGCFFANWYAIPNPEKTLKLLKKIAQNRKKVFDKSANI